MNPEKKEEEKGGEIRMRDLPRDRIRYLNQQIELGNLPFPYYLNYVDSPEQMFRRMQAYQGQGRYEKYRLKSYYPPDALRGLYLPPLFRGKSVYLRSEDSLYEQIDVLTDHFLQDVRLQTHRLKDASVMDYWINSTLRGKYLTQLVKEETLDFPTMYRVLANMTAESKHFRPTWALGLFSLVWPSGPSNLRILDISAGWGDRLVACLARGYDYFGTDPDEALQPAYQELILRFGDPKRHQVSPTPFEQTELPTELFDGILTSPPFGDLEIYPGENQSSATYPSFNQWMKEFLFVSLSRAWERLKVGGYLMIHMGDALAFEATAERAQGFEVRICTPMNLYIEEYLVGASWEGIIGVSGVVGSARPVWVWKKVASPPARWNAKFPRSLQANYPELVPSSSPLSAPLIPLQPMRKPAATVRRILRP